jgi:hypothetical protein
MWSCHLEQQPAEVRSRPRASPSPRQTGARPRPSPSRVWTTRSSTAMRVRSSGAASSGDPLYSGTDAADVGHQYGQRRGVRHGDRPQLVTSEAGSTATLTLPPANGRERGHRSRAATWPGHGGAGQRHVHPSQLEPAPNVTVTGVDDGRSMAASATRSSSGGVSPDPTYTGWTRPMSATNTDDDTAGVVVTLHAW